MRIIPPEVPTIQENTEISTPQQPQDSQPSTNTQNPTNTSLQAIKTEEKMLNSDQNPSIITSPQSSILNTEPKEIVIRKKAQYRSFMKLIKAKKYTSAVLTARILGVDRNTLTSWLQTKKVKELLAETYNSYINDIEKAKDWKAKAYLLDKLEDQDKTRDNIVDLKQMIVINT